MNTITVRRQRIYKNRMKCRLVFFSALTLALLLVVIFADQLCPYDPNQQDILLSLQPPSLRHPAGTDRFGRDMLSRILVGLKTSIGSALMLVAIIAVTGTAAGVLCGFYGGILDSVMMRVADVCLAFPGLVLAMAIAAMLNGGMKSAVIALAAVGWPKYARIARSQTLVLKNADFIAAARLAGSSSAQIIFRHIFPNSLGPVLVTAMLDIGTMLMELAGLSYLGLGAQPPTAELGSMMSSGRSMLQTCPWVVIGPGIGIFIAAAVFNLLGDTVRDYLDPQSSQ